MTPDQLIFLIENLFDPIVFLPTTVYLLIAVLLKIRDCARDDLDVLKDQGLITDAGYAGHVAYLTGVLMSSVMFQRAEAVEEGELDSYWSGDWDEYNLIHLKWTLAYCQDTGEYEWLKTE